MLEEKSYLPVHVVHHEVDANIIHQRISDGYINATAMCQACGKDYGQYSRLEGSKAFIEALSAELQISSSELVQVRKGGDPFLQGTWVHPQVAINLGQWLSPRFAVLVSKWFYEWVSGNIQPKTEIPYHIRRYIANRSEVPFTHFSVLNELIFNLIAPLEGEGYSLPESLMPDISEGQMFANWLRKEKQLDPSGFPRYLHRFEDGRKVKARLYPNELLGEFRMHFYNVWLPERATPYFTEKDPRALAYLPKLIALTAASNAKFVEVNEKPLDDKVAKARKFNKAISKAAPPVLESAGKGE